MTSCAIPEISQKGQYSHQESGSCISSSQGSASNERRVYKPTDHIPLLERLVGAHACDILELVGSVVSGCITGPILSHCAITMVLSRHFTREYPLAYLMTVCISALGGGAGSSLLYNEYKRSQIEQSLDQIQRGSLGNPESILILESKGDPSKDMPLRETVSVIRELAKMYCIERKVISDPDDFCDVFTLERKHIEIQLLGHGNKKGVRLGNFFLTIKYSDLLSKLKKAIKPGGRIVLDACKTGEGEENFAKDLSIYCPDATIYASEALVYPSDYGKKDKEGAPVFSTSLGHDHTRIYKNGVLQKKPRIEPLIEDNSCRYFMPLLMVALLGISLSMILQTYP